MYRLACFPEFPMPVDQATVRRIAHLARIKIDAAEVPHLASELNAILAFVEELAGVDVEGVEPMTSVMPMRMKERADVVTDGNIADQIVANAPATDDHYFVVPKVVE
jgi:aspartyl-tRNA(Asn)/glutamyl-tRNA(Gln) amidotransferase subunit C